MSDDSENLFNLLQELDKNTSDDISQDRRILRVPFGYPGGKSHSVKFILPRLPYYTSYVEPFGGSAAILLARYPSKLEVFNDRYAGVVSFYRCIRDETKLQKLINRLKLTIHSREEFVWCKETWKNVNDDVERAARWYYLNKYSFGGKGRHWGRSTNTKAGMAGKISNALSLFPLIHKRFKAVQVENQDWYDCILDYDTPETVFYLDPPYIDASSGIYDEQMKKSDYIKLLETIFSCKGFVALSGYSNPIFENNEWDNRFEWEVFVSLRGASYHERSHHANLKHIDTGRSTTKEILWIKEAN